MVHGCCLRGWRWGLDMGGVAAYGCLALLCPFCTSGSWAWCMGAVCAAGGGDEQVVVTAALQLHRCCWSYLKTSYLAAQRVCAIRPLCGLPVRGDLLFASYRRVSSRRLVQQGGDWVGGLIVSGVDCARGGQVRRDLAAGRLPPVQPFHAMAYPFSAELALAISAKCGPGSAVSSGSGSKNRLCSPSMRWHTPSQPSWRSPSAPSAALALL